MHKQHNATAGFTIVELLIVIVVIAILAAISVVAYTGIQNRANDSTVQSDINSLANRIALYHAEFGTYPTVIASNGGISGVDNVKVAKSSYLTNNTHHNFYYCRGTVSGSPAFAIGAISKSNNRYYHSSLQGGVKVYEGEWGMSTQICPGMLPGLANQSHATGWDAGAQSWYSWIN